MLRSSLNQIEDAVFRPVNENRVTASSVDTMLFIAQRRQHTLYQQSGVFKDYLLSSEPFLIQE